MKTFEELLSEKTIRKKLVAAGIKQSTITMWKQGNRHPNLKNARDLARILRIPLKSIPWTELQWKVNNR